MEYEILEALETQFAQEKDYLAECYKWLYENIQNNLVKVAIEKWFDDNHYCIFCGKEMSFYEYEMYHSEVAFDNIEMMGIYVCNNE